MFHQRKYDKLLLKTTFKLSKEVKDIDSDIVRYQGLSSFYKKNYYHSKMCFEILSEKESDKPLDYIYLAFLYSRQNEKEKAISSWCKCLEIDKNNYYAKKALDYVREKGRELNLIEDAYFDKLVPSEPFFLPLKQIFFFIIILVFIASILYGGYSGAKYIYSRLKKEKLLNRKELDKIYLDDFNPNIIVTPKDITKQYSYSEKEIKEKFEKIKLLILENKSIEPQILINQIKLSNASPSVKMKTEILEDFIIEPDYGFFKNVVTFQDFQKEKLLYSNVYVLWKGRIINKSIYKDKITFDLIIGDEEAGVIDAIIPVIFEKPVIINNNENLSIFGMIKFEEVRAFISGKYIIRN